MDIFTTVLTRVRTTPIKPEKLRVKALLKEPATGKLTDDIDHLEDHDLYFVSEKKQGDPQKNKEEHKTDFTDKDVVPSESATIDKQSIINPKKNSLGKANDDDIEHLDIFV